MMNYILSQYDKLWYAFVEHLQIVGITLIISLIIALALSFLILSSRNLANAVIQALEIMYSIPSMAVFAMLVPITGLGMDSAIIALVVYNQYILVRNIVTGITGVDPVIVEAAIGMGMTRSQLMYKIQIPLALPMVLAGIRLAVISTTGIATIASMINAGGLGDIIFDGLRTTNQYKIIAGAILSAAIIVIINGVIRGIEYIYLRKSKQII